MSGFLLCAFIFTFLMGACAGGLLVCSVFNDDGGGPWDR